MLACAENTPTIHPRPLNLFLSHYPMRNPHRSASFIDQDQKLNIHKHSKPYCLHLQHRVLGLTMCIQDLPWRRALSKVSRYRRLAAIEPKPRANRGQATGDGWQWDRPVHLHTCRSVRLPTLPQTRGRCSTMVLLNHQDGIYLCYLGLMDLFSRLLPLDSVSRLLHQTLVGLDDLLLLRRLPRSERLLERPILTPLEHNEHHLSLGIAATSGNRHRVFHLFPPPLVLESGFNHWPDCSSLCSS
jgi:hypothetical protein